MSSTKFLIIGSTIIGSLLLSGCQSQIPLLTKPTQNQQSGSAAETNKVSIASNAFNPADITVKVGETVIWTNSDGFAHTVTADDGSFSSGSVAQGKTFTHTFTKAGSFTYHCSIHTYMNGKVTVTQ